MSEKPTKVVRLIYYLSKNDTFLFKILRRLLFLILHLEIPSSAIRKNMGIVHPYNIIINPRAELGYDITIFNNVTIGSVDKVDRSLTPKIGNNVVFFPYSVIAGDIIIGDNVVIQAGSIVLTDIPPNSLVAGNPAKVVKKINKTRLTKFQKKTTD